MKRALAVCALAVALVASGCGSTSSSSGTQDPAKLAPGGTLAYVSFELAPQGPEKADFDAAFGKLLGADPETQLAKGFTDAVKEAGSKLDYEQDVKPWLGGTVAAVLTGIGNQKPDFALLVASTDDDKARAAIDTDLAGSSALSTSYRGVGYKLIDGGTANGVVDHFLVAGTEAAFKAVVDADKDGKSLADSQAWQDSVGNRGDGKVGLGFFDLKAIIQSAISRAPGAERILAPLALGFLQIHPFVATLDANPDSLVVDVSSPGTAADKRGPGAASSPLIETLPGDAWFAVALPKVGQVLGKLASALRLNPIIASEYARVAKQLKRRSGLDLTRDVLAGVGDLGAYARGSSAKTISAGLVVSGGDRAALRRTVAGLPRLLARAHGLNVRRRAGGFDVTGWHMKQPVEVRSAGPGAIAAYGSGSVKRTVAPATRLGGSDLFRTAGAALGARPTLFVSFAPLLALARTAHGHQHEHHRLSAQDRARLAHLEYLAVGARNDGGLDLVRAVLGIH